MPINISQEAIALQQDYATQVYRMRGYLPRGESLPPPDGESVKLGDYCVEEGAIIGVTGDNSNNGEFRSPPLFAQIGQVPVKVRSELNPQTAKFKLEIIAPSLSGKVEFVWPSRTVFSEERLTVNQKKQDITVIDIKPGAWRPDGLLHLPLRSAPTRVCVGAFEIPADDFQWTAKTQYQEAELVVLIRKRTPPGQLVIATATTLYQSSDILDPRKYYTPVQPLNP